MDVRNQRGRVPMDKEERQELTEYFDGRYVLRAECDTMQADISKKLHSDDKRLAVIEYQQKVNNWLTAAIAAGIVSLVIKVFLGG